MSNMNIINYIYKNKLNKCSYIFFCAYLYTFLLNIPLGVELLSHMICLRSALEGNCQKVTLENEFSKIVEPLYVSQ